MCDKPNYTIHGSHHHFGWDNSFPPALTVAPGDRIHLQCLDSSGGQLTASSTTEDLPNLSFDKINPVTGPIFVEGAEPGDILQLEIEAFQPSGFGWTGNIPGFGLLADQFPDPFLKVWKYDPKEMAPAVFSDLARIPLKPFAGTIGLAPAEAGWHTVVPPRRMGGNMDIRDLTSGTTLYLPVEVAGALLSIGDTHAAQGDGEVCGTAIESPMELDVQVKLIKQTALDFPRFQTPGPVTRHLDAKGYDVTTGIGPDLWTGARAAVSSMIDLLSKTHGLSAVEAYLLCSVCGDLRISEIVDMPNWVVSFYFPRVVFE